MEHKISSINKPPVEAVSREIKDTPQKKKTEAAPVAAGDTVSISKEVKPGKNVKVSVYPQDPVVSAPEKIDFPKEKIGEKLTGERVEIQDNNPTAIADPDGNYFYNAGTPQFDQVNSYTTVYNTLDMYQDFIGHKLDWAFDSSKIGVYPRKQEGKNAYYARSQESVNFFYFDSKELGKTVNVSESSDVVSHETGHAVLDGLRPGYMGWFSGTETMAFHEAFGDITAMLLCLKDGNNVKGILADNGGDFTKESRLTRLAEEFGKAIHLEDSDPSNDNKIYLRTMINDFKYKDPSTLPDQKADDHLTSEVHNFSRLFSAAFYDCIEGAYNQNIGKGGDKVSALSDTGADLGKIFTRGVELSPSSNVKYKDIALCMLKADKELTGGKYSDVLKKAFMDREIIKSSDIKNESIEDFMLTKPLKTKEDAIELIDSGRLNVNLPDNVQVDNLYTNKNGETFVSYSYGKEIPVQGKGLERFEGVVTHVGGGLTLAFDSNGKLSNKVESPVTSAVVDDAMREIKDYAEAGLVKKGDIKSRPLNENNEPYRAVLLTTKSGKKILQKIPVIVD
ncbi:MAG: hypothetical protein M1269_04405 [Chloroflexi bacterium]|nr:hypothetical protein [Chloroflexota bacterium]